MNEISQGNKSHLGNMAQFADNLSSVGADLYFNQFFKAYVEDLDPSTMSPISQDILNAINICGLNRTPFSRPTTLIGLATGMLMSKGYTVSEIIGGAVPKDNMRAAGDAVLTSFVDEKKCGEMMATVTKAYSNTKDELSRSIIYKSKLSRERLYNSAISHNTEAIQAIQPNKLYNVDNRTLRREYLNSNINYDSARAKSLQISLNHKYVVNNPEEFDLSTKLSDAFVTGLKAQKQESPLQKAVDDYFRAHPQSVRGTEKKDFYSLPYIDEDLPPKDLNPTVSEYFNDYFSGDERKRKNCLDVIFDRYDALDPTDLDLSCLSEKTAHEGLELTESEKDLLKFEKIMSMDEMIMSKKAENPEYFEKRYSSETDKARFNAKRNLINSYKDYYNDLLYANGISPEGTRSVDPSIYSSYLSKDCCYANTLVAVTDEYNTQMKLLDEKNSPDGSKWDDNMESSAIVKITDKDSKDSYSDVLGGFLDEKKCDYLKNNFGLDMGDVFFIDGKSAKSYFNGPQTNNEYREKIMDTLRSGEHRVEFANVLTDKLGSYRLSITSIKPDMHALDAEEKSAKHGKFRRFFDFGPSKIKTTADKSDILWKDDKNKTLRHDDIRLNLSANILNNVKNIKKSASSSRTPISFNELNATQNTLSRRKRAMSVPIIKKEKESQMAM